MWYNIKEFILFVVHLIVLLYAIEFQRLVA